MENKICGIPFAEMAFHPRRHDEKNLIAIPCCSSWLKPPYSLFTINVKEDPCGNIDVMGAWNSAEYATFRRSILDGSYRYCRSDICPHLISGNLPSVPAEALPFIEKGKTCLDYPPLSTSISIDRACNLACPSCRPRLNNIPNEKTYQRILSLLSSGTGHIFINGSGEIFINKHIMRVFRDFSFKKYPDIHGFSLITNGTALNKTAWYSLSEDFRSAVHDINVSVDSPVKEVYEKIRVGGNFEILLKNMIFISELRKENILKCLVMTSVLQKLTIGDLPKFIQYAISCHADHLILNKIENWGHYSDNQFKMNMDLPGDWDVTYRTEIIESINLMRANNITWTSNVLPQNI
jgi:sulfatase maturation enzyme AslB (radical SAM superfamily)